MELKSQLTGKTSNIFIQLVRYCLTGGVAFVVDFCTLYVLTNFLGLHYLIGATCGFCLGLVITYLGSIFWIFDKRRMQDRRIELGVFTIIGLVGLVLTDLFMWLFTDVSFAGFNYMISKIITTVIVTAWNFIAKKYILFTSKE